MGYHRGTSLPEYLRGKLSYGDGYHILHHNSKENFVLYCQFDLTYGFDLISLRVGLLLACGSWREGIQYLLLFSLCSIP